MSGEIIVPLRIYNLATPVSAYCSTIKHNAPLYDGETISEKLTGLNTFIEIVKQGWKVSTHHTEEDRKAYEEEVSQLQQAIDGLEKVPGKVTTELMIEGRIVGLGFTDPPNPEIIAIPQVEWAFLTIDSFNEKVEGEAGSYSQVKVIEVEKFDDELNKEGATVRRGDSQSEKVSGTPPKEPQRDHKQQPGLSKQDQRISAILEIVDEIGFTANAIPDGGKARMKRELCAQEGGLFTSSTFDAAWKTMRRARPPLIEMENNEKYIP